MLVKKFIHSWVPRLLHFGVAIFTFLQFHKQRAKFAYLLLWESGLSATFRLNDAHQAATKDEKWLRTYQKSTKQNDNVTMTFSVNSSLQCFRTAALSMVSLNMESWNPMGRVNAENHSKTWKSSGVNELNTICRSHVNFVIYILYKTVIVLKLVQYCLILANSAYSLVS